MGTTEQTGELWLYLPGYAQKLTIQHQVFGVLRNYVYPVSIEPGRTYEMLLDIGTGRYATVTGTVAGADITIDGEYVGKAPIYNRYMNYGKHTVKAVHDRFEGSLDVAVTTDAGKDKPLQFNVEMLDMTPHYGDVTVTADNNADIYFQGRKVGTGTWQTQLREGKYILETHKADCDSMKTAFTVVAQRQNDIKANPPTQHTGYLSIYTRPRNAAATIDGRTPISLTETQSVPVGTHQIDLTRKGYVSLSKEYTVRRFQITADTIEMERINYVKPQALYFGLGYTVRSMSGLTGYVGYVYKNHDAQLSYTFGLTTSGDILWYDGDRTNTQLLGTANYKMSSLALKYGYQFRLLSHLGFTPQAGYSYNHLQGSFSGTAGGEKYGDGASAHCLTVGVKLLYAPVQRCYIFATPEFQAALAKDDAYKSIARTADLSAGGFALHFGALVNF